jgi:hypothetical protein
MSSCELVEKMVSVLPPANLNTKMFWYCRRGAYDESYRTFGKSHTALVEYICDIHAKYIRPKCEFFKADVRYWGTLLPLRHHAPPTRGNDRGSYTTSHNHLQCNLSSIGVLPYQIVQLHEVLIKGHMF